MRRSPNRFTLLAVAAVVVIALLIGYQRLNRPVTSESVAVATRPSSATPTAPDTTNVDSAAVDSASVATSVSVRTPGPVAKRAPAQPSAGTPERAVSLRRPAEPAVDAPVTESTPTEPVRKPVPKKCDQLVLRNGDLVDAEITEVGVREIRYRRCNWLDGPNYVVSRADVLSIRFANGDIERL